jgi:hypothetical protein
MDVAQFTDPKTAGRICFVAVIGFFAVFYPEMVSNMFLLLGIGFIVLGLLLAFAGDMIGFAAYCVELVWQWFPTLPARWPAKYAGGAKTKYIL